MEIGQNSPVKHGQYVKMTSRYVYTLIRLSAYYQRFDLNDPQIRYFNFVRCFGLVLFLLNFNRVLSMKTFLIYFKFVILLKTALEIQCQLKEYVAWIFHEA